MGAVDKNGSYNIKGLVLSCMGKCFVTMYLKQNCRISNLFCYTFLNKKIKCPILMPQKLKAWFWDIQYCYQDLVSLYVESRYQFFPGFLKILKLFDHVGFTDCLGSTSSKFFCFSKFSTSFEKIEAKFGLIHT